MNIKKVTCFLDYNSRYVYDFPCTETEVHRTETEVHRVVIDLHPTELKRIYCTICGKEYNEVEFKQDIQYPDHETKTHIMNPKKRK